MSDVTAPRDWTAMREQRVRLLERSTGADLDTWNARTAASGAADEPALRAWLDEQGVHGYAQMLLVFERFGYPDFFLVGAEELIAGQYADRPHLRAVLDRLLDVAPSLGEVAVQARKTYVTLLTPRRTFAQVRASTRSRVDVGLRLADVPPSGRLLPPGAMAGSAMTARLALAVPDDVDDEVVQLLQRTYDANL